VTRAEAEAVLGRLHAAQAELYSGGDPAAVRTDGTATIGGAEHRWATVGLYELRDGRVASCHLLALDQRAFDAAWADPHDSLKVGP
jgi:hypothetical protein